jgi:hypothetical protein
MMIDSATAFKAAQFTKCLGPLSLISDNTAAGLTLVARYAPRIIKASGTAVRLNLGGFIAAGHDTTISKVTIGLAPSLATAKPYDTTTTPTNITFRGSDSVALTRGSLHISDQITFTIDGSKAIIIAYNIPAGGFATYATGLTFSDYGLYWKAGAEAGTQTKAASYLSTGGLSPFLMSLECIS